MVSRVATDEGPLQTPSSDDSGTGRSGSPSDNSETEANVVVPPDGGWGWVVVVTSFACNVLVDGIILSSSNMLKKMTDEFQVTEAKAAPIMSLQSGFYLLAGPFVSALANKYGFQVVTIAGSIIAGGGMSLAYFAESVEYLYIVYGVLVGIGFCMVYMPAVLIVGFYFEKWRALATGLALCGSGVGTFLFSPLSKYLIEQLGWRKTLFVQTAFALLCAVCGATFKPIKPVRVTLADQPEEKDENKKHDQAVEKLNTMLKNQNNLDSKIAMPHEIKFSNNSNAHTWMGVANNKQYPTAEEVFRKSNSNLNRRPSANSAVLKNSVSSKPLFITTVVTEKDERDEPNGTDNTEPLIASAIKVVPAEESKHRSSNADLSRPLYRDDIFFSSSLARLPQYTSRSSLAYHLAVTHVPTKEEAQEERSGRCRICPEAVRRTLATMLDFSLFKSPTFVILALSGFFTMLGYFVPFLYLPLRYNSVTGSDGSILVSTIGIANILGRITSGLISSVPKVSPLWLNNIALSLGGIATLLSGLSYNPIFQHAYAVIFGLAIACFASLRSILVVEYIGLEQLTNCFGLFLLFQGIGALAGSPIAGLLKDLTGTFDASFYLAGVFLLASGLMCFPINIISRWEKERSKKPPAPKV